MSGLGDAWDTQAHRALFYAGADESGYVGRLTPAEQEALDFIKAETSRTHPEHKLQDKDFCRFLRACEFKQKDALKMLVADLEWRATENPSEISLEEVRGPFDNGNFLPVGRDKRGRPTMFYFAKHHDPKIGKQSAKLTLYTMEQKCKEVEGTEEETFTMVSKCHLVFDMTGYGMRNYDVSWCWNVISTLQKHFPERLGTCLVMNAPSVFGMLWSVIKPWLAKRTREKIIFVDGDYKAKLRSFVDAEHIPVLLGGTMDYTPQKYIAEQLPLSSN